MEKIWTFCPVCMDRIDHSIGEDVLICNGCKQRNPLVPATTVAMMTVASDSIERLERDASTNVS
jgi:hypothetical protein